MRIGLDIALYSSNHAVDRVVLISNDTDCLPALKLGRRSGLQIVIAELPTCHIAPEITLSSTTNGLFLGLKFSPKLSPSKA